MNNPESVAIINRFFEALSMLVANKTIRGISNFTDKHDISRWTLNNVRKNPKSDMFQLVWISYLVTDYGVSLEWVMTGKGGMFVKEKNQNNEPLIDIREYIDKDCEVTYSDKSNEKKSVQGIVKEYKRDREQQFILSIQKEGQKTCKRIPATKILTIVKKSDN